MVPFEKDNTEAYRLLLTIEVTLRELLQRTFEVASYEARVRQVEASNARVPQRYPEWTR